MAYYTFPVSPGKYVGLTVPGTLTPVEWDRMMTVLALFRDGLVVEDDPTEVVTLSGQRLTTGTDPQLTRKTWSQTPPYEEVE